MAPPRAFISLGDPVMDVIAHVETLPFSIPEPGGCLPIDGPGMERLLSELPPSSRRRRAPGGSASNVARGVAELLRRLSGPPSSDPSLSPSAIEVVFMGMVGDDETAREYESALVETGVAPRLLRAKAEGENAGDGDCGENNRNGEASHLLPLPTATCLCLVTPGGQRTMRTCLGAASLLKREEQLPGGWCAGAAAVHVEGYALWREGLAAGVTSAARRRRRSGAAGDGETSNPSPSSSPSNFIFSPPVITSIDCSSFEVVRARREELEALLGTGDVDILFCNEEEAAALAEGGEGEEGEGEGGGGEEERNCVISRALRRALELGARVAVACMGAAGARAMAKRSGKREEAGEEIGEGDKHFSYHCYSCPAEAVESVADTVGAGDAFAAGFLMSLLLSSSSSSSGGGGGGGDGHDEQERGEDEGRTDARDRVFRGDAVEAALRLGCAASAAAVRAAGADLGKEAWDSVAAKVTKGVKEEKKAKEKERELALA